MSISSLSTEHNVSLDLWEVDFFGSEESNEIEPLRPVLKNNYSVPMFVLA